MLFGPSLICVVYFTTRGFLVTRRRRTVDEALTDMDGGRKDGRQRQVCSGKEFKTSMANW